MIDVVPIKLNILLIEDNERFSNSISSAIEQKYKVHVETCKDGKDIERILNSNIFDILVFDYHLKGDDTGADLINKIELNNGLHEIILYSSDDIPANAIGRQVRLVDDRDELEGVIGEYIHSIKDRFLSYPNLIGNFIGSAIDIENMMEEIILENIFPGLQEIFQERILNQRFISFDNKYRIIKGYLERIKIGKNNFEDKNKQLIKTYTELRTEIVDTRNVLAHSKMNVNGELQKMGNLQNNIKPNFQWYEKSRSSIIKHKKNLVNIKNELDANKNIIQYVSELE